MANIADYLKDKYFFSQAKEKIEERFGLTKSNVISTFRFNSKFLDLFDSLTVREFDSEVVNVELDSAESFMNEDLLVFINELFKLYGKDSNLISVEDVPNVNVFGGESYCWYLSVDNTVIYDGYDDFHHAVILTVNHSKCSLNLINVHNLFEMNTLH